MRKSKEFFNKKAITKHYIIVGSIFILIFAITSFIYFRTTEIIYACISLTSLLFFFLTFIIYSLKNFKKELMYGAYILFMLLNVLILMGIVAKLMYKYTNIDTAVWLNSISTMVASLLGAVILGIVSYVVLLKQINNNNEVIEKQIESSNESIEKQIEENKQLTRYTLEESRNEKEVKNRSIALNYIFLLNAEMNVHKEIYNTYLKTYKSIVSISTEYMFKRFNSKMWNDAKVECAKCFTNELMQELIGYYYGVESFKEIKFNKSDKEKVIKGQLDSMYKCIKIIELEFIITLRSIEVCDADDKK